MGIYIDIIMDGDEKFANNVGLIEVLTYIGHKESIEDMTDSAALKKGLRVVNQRLNKGHKRAIRRLIAAEVKQYRCVGNKEANKNVWRIHRWKAKRIFRVIRDIVRRYDSDDVKKKFEEIRSKGFSDNAHGVGDPYYSLINSTYYLDAYGYDEMEVRSFKKCVGEINQYNGF